VTGRPRRGIRIVHVLRRLLAVLALCSVAAGGARAGDPELWLGALEPPWRAARGLPANDYLGLFRADADWPTVAAHLSEVQLSKRFVMEAAPEVLAGVLADLARRHIAVAMQMLALVPGPACGLGVAGYGARDDARRQAERIRQAGGTLDAAVMETPLWSGHFDAGRPGHAGCQMPVAAAAQQALAKIAQVRQVFPAVRIGEAEPVGDAVDVHEFDEALVEWFADLTLASGRRPSFLQAEVAWQHPGWQDALRASEAFARTQGVRFGVVYNGGLGDLPDPAWRAATQRHYREVEASLGVAPDIAAFVSATPRPSRLLPESDADTLTGAILGYLRFRKRAE
jgi:hypothetical protein